MTGSLNRAEIIGHVGKDPDIRYLPDGTAVANFSLATSERWRDKGSGEQREATEWHRVTMFGKLAELVEQYVRKGSYLRVAGKLRTRKWQDKDGQDRYTTEINAFEMLFLDKREDGEPQKEPAKQAAKQEAPKEFADLDDDIPF